MRLVAAVPRNAPENRTFELPVESQAVLELARAQELETGMARVVALLRHACAAAGLEFRAPNDEGESRLVASDGAGAGRRHRFPLGPAGEVFVVGCCDPRLATAVASVVRILRRRAEEWLARATTSLARRNQELEEFAALVAHELKTPLHSVKDSSGDGERLAEGVLGLGIETYTGAPTLLRLAHDIGGAGAILGSANVRPDLGRRAFDRDRDALRDLAAQSAQSSSNFPAG